VRRAGDGAERGKHAWLRRQLEHRAPVVSPALVCRAVERTLVGNQAGNRVCAVGAISEAVQDAQVRDRRSLRLSSADGDGKRGRCHSDH
jgi:hypothetical protein